VYQIKCTSKRKIKKNVDCRRYGKLGKCTVLYCISGTAGKLECAHVSLGFEFEIECLGLLKGNPNI